jgi:hypothetical protein
MANRRAPASGAGRRATPSIGVALRGAPPNAAALRAHRTAGAYGDHQRRVLQAHPAQCVERTFQIARFSRKRPQLLEAAIDLSADGFE